MMTPQMTPEMLLAMSAPLAIAGAGWVLRRWISRVDGKLEAFTSQVGDMRLKAAVADERFSSLLGALDEFRRTALQTTRDLGKLTSAVEKLWAVLQAKGLLEPRLSDQVLDRTGTGK